MNFSLMYKDELSGFLRSKVMLVLVVGLPLLVVLLRLFRPDAEGMSLFVFSAILISSIGGTLSAVLLSTSITNEKQRHAYDLFLIRPVTRATLLLAKYFAALTSLVIASIIALGIGVITDLIAGYPTGSLLEAAGQPLLLSLSGMAIACAVGLLLGVLLESVVAAAIIAVYLGNQLSALAVLPSVFLTGINTSLLAVGIGTVIPAGLLFLAIRVFNRKTM
ncbi:MAG: hypothetical protein E4H09_00125 [Spirochaetales bacterium]|nr:MAG: hypothetical protein E4H09_00125 [Spirochaetales bacterium]